MSWDRGEDDRRLLQEYLAPIVAESIDRDAKVLAKITEENESLKKQLNSLSGEVDVLSDDRFAWMLLSYILGGLSGFLILFLLQ